MNRLLDMWLRGCRTGGAGAACYGAWNSLDCLLSAVCEDVAEARGGLHIVEQSLWAAVPAFLRKLSLALKKHTGRELPINATPLTFGSWMGGDRDGNPNVTAPASLPTMCGPWPCHQQSRYGHVLTSHRK